MYFISERRWLVRIFMKEVWKAPSGCELKGCYLIRLHRVFRRYHGSSMESNSSVD
jgi:hypothetical protein